MTTWCLTPTLFLYTLASLLYLVVSFRPRLMLSSGKRPWLEDLALFATVTGVLCHLVYLIYNHSWGDFLSLQSCGIVLLYLWVALKFRWQSLGSLFLPLALIFFVFSLQRGPATSAWITMWSGHSGFLMFHVFAALLTILFMAGTFLLGIAFLLHERNLKQKKWDLLFLKLPPLLLNEKKALIWLRFGFVFLTLVLITGTILLRTISLSSWQLLHVVLALVAWIIYGLILNRRWLGLGGRRMLLLSFFGFVSLTTAFLWN